MNPLLEWLTGLSFVGWATDVMLGITLVLAGASLASLGLGWKRPADRHALWFGVLLVVLSVPVVSAVTRPLGWILVSVPFSKDVPRIEIESTGAGGSERPIELARSRDVEAAGIANELSQPLSDGISPGSTDATAPLGTPASPAISTSMGGDDGRNDPISGSRLSVMQYAMGIWLAGVLLIFTRRVIGWSHVWRIRRDARPLDQEAYGSLLEHVSRAMPVKRPIPVMVSSLARVPMVVGLLVPAVLLPRRMLEQTSRAGLIQTLIHEMAHVGRKDHWALALERWATALFWPHPLIHWMSRELDRAREELCDNHVLAASRPADYADTLLGLAQLCLPTRDQSLSVLWGRHALPSRIRRLLDRRRDRTTVLTTQKRWALAALVGALGCLTVLIRTGSSAQAADATATDQAQVAELVQALTAHRHVFEDADAYAAQLYELNRVGPSTVPDLMEALDRTEEDVPLRLLGFALRSMGDPRAVPALIRAIPKTLRPAGSDCGVTLSEDRLLAFMQAHDLNEESPQDKTFDLGRPVREIFGALQKLTGTTQGEQELYHVFLGGAQQQRDLQRQLYHEMAVKWAGWWSLNWTLFVSDPAFAEVRLPAVEPSMLKGPIDTGPKYMVGGGHANVIVSPVEHRDRGSFIDLDTNRAPDWPDAFTDSDEQRLIHALLVWAARDGVDLMGMEFTPPGSSRTYYCVRGVGLQAWQIANERWDTIKDELASDQPLQLGPPAGDLLMDYDAELAAYVPSRRATFLFRTREGAQGILRIVAQVTRLFPAEGPAAVPIDPGADPMTILRTRFGMPAPKGSPIPPDQWDHEFGFNRGVTIEYRLFYPAE
jgi:beta-lactamase regulating signal transducer with metallopeptidase domain